MENLKEKHSRLGIASFMISIIFLIHTISFISGILLLFRVIPYNFIIQPKPLTYFSLISISVLSFIGLGFGVGGLLQKKRRKGFAIAGFIFNALNFSAVVMFFIAIILTFPGQD